MFAPAGQVIDCPRKHAPGIAPDRIELKVGSASGMSQESEKKKAATTSSAVSAQPMRLDDPNYIAKLAHELKTPLSAIAAAAEIMRDERLGPIGSERYRGYAGDIHDVARHALDIINAMLQARAAGGEPAPLATAEIDLNDLAARAVSAMQPLAERSRLAIELDFEPRLPHISADVLSVRQILFNLIANALKFTASGGVMRVSTRQTRAGRVEIEIADTGTGMSAREIAEALDKTSPPAPGPRREGGLGFGLPLVRALAEANGAELSILSEVGKGTTATVSFAKDRVTPG